MSCTLSDDILLNALSPFFRRGAVCFCFDRNDVACALCITTRRKVKKTTVLLFAVPMRFVMHFMSSLVGSSVRALVQNDAPPTLHAQRISLM